MIHRIFIVILGVAMGRSLLAEDKAALLVGVAEYQHARMNASTLKYPEADAKSVGKLLTESGYHVVTLTGNDATQEKVITALKSISGRGDSDGVILLGFFGHGVQYGSEAYFCPYDTSMRLAKDSDGKTLYEGSRPRVEPDPESLVPMRAMLETLTLSGAGNRMLLADCCREDPNAARGLSSRAFGSSVRVDQLPRNCACLFACSQGGLAYESDDWGHGAFTRAFLDACADRQRVTANGLSESVYLGVEKLVSAQGKRQRVNSILTAGLVDLKLSRREPVKPRQEPMNAREGSSLRESSRSIRNSIGSTMVLVPSGTFLMGSNLEVKSAEKSGEMVLEFGSGTQQRRVTISRDFYMGTTEVTQGQWKKVMGTEPWKVKDSVREGDDYPATYVSWEDAVEFCRRLTERESRTYRLPTEAEWEYACRAGSQTPYSFGKDPAKLREFAWFDENAKSAGEAYAHQVGQKHSNSFGLFDMHGNVTEWCSDFTSFGQGVKTSAVTDPTGPSTGGMRVTRGGDWEDISFHCASGRSGMTAPNHRHSSLGFRLVSLSQSTSDFQGADEKKKSVGTMKAQQESSKPDLLYRSNSSTPVTSGSKPMDANPGSSTNAGIFVGNDERSKRLREELMTQLEKQVTQDRALEWQRNGELDYAIGVFAKRASSGGLRVTSVEPLSIASRIGLEKGDVIVSLGWRGEYVDLEDDEIATSEPETRNAFLSIDSITVDRDGRRLSFSSRGGEGKWAKLPDFFQP